MSNILILTGPSGAGKTTTAEAFLKQAKGVWAHLPQDEIRQIIKAGYQTADDYEKNWNADTRNQWDVSIPLIADMAKRYSQYDINVLIDCFAPPNEMLRWRESLERLDYKTVLLLPSEDEVVRRNAGREARARLKEGVVRANFQKFVGWQGELSLKLDTTSIVIDDVVAQLNSLL